MSRNDPDWLNAQYDNRARVADHGRHLARWAEASALVRANSDCRLDLGYGHGPAESLDLFLPARQDSQAAPVLVFLHGGWWRSLDKSDFSFVAPAFNAAGALVAVPNYTLCPAGSIEDICRQMLRALQWLWQHAARHGGDPRRITVVGHSAGGHLAAMLLSCRWKQLDTSLPAQLVGGAMAISGLFDLEPLRHTPFLQADLRLTPAAVRRLSPAFFPRPRGRLHAVVGAAESEEFLRQTQLIRDVWGPTAVPVCETVPGHHHFDVLQSLVDPGGRLHDLALRLLGLR